MGAAALEGNAMRPRPSFTMLCTSIVAACAGLFVNASAAADTPSPGANSSTSQSNAVASTLIIVVGAVGAPEFESNFLHQAQLWTEAGKRGQAAVTTIGQSTEEQSLTDFDALKQTLGQQPTDGTEPLWLVLIGHGTFDGKEARFNLRGP